MLLSGNKEHLHYIGHITSSCVLHDIVHCSKELARNSTHIYAVNVSAHVSVRVA